MRNKIYLIKYPIYYYSRPHNNHQGKVGNLHHRIGLEKIVLPLPASSSGKEDKPDEIYANHLMTPTVLFVYCCDALCYIVMDYFEQL